MSGAYSFSAELGGFRIVSVSGKGTKSDPIVIAEEFDSASPVILVIRTVRPIRPFDYSGNYANGFMHLRIEALNNSALPWIEFEFELQEQLHRASVFGDGLSFDQRRADSGNIASGNFHWFSRDFEPYDRLLFRDGKIDHGEVASFEFMITDFTPRWEFFSAGSPHPLLLSLQTRVRRANPQIMVSISGMRGLRELLAFYREAGADDALVEAAPDRFAQSTVNAPRQAEAPAGERAAGPAGRGSRAAPPSGLARAAPPVAVPDGAQAALARTRAATASSLEELRACLSEFEGCNLRFTAKNLVFADGNPDADVMLVGEAPGREEDLEGLPFVGRSGQLLDRMLAAIGLDRGSVYIANVIPWRPPGNRTPTPQETEICRPFIERQIELAAPKVLVTLGGPSAKLITGAPEGILRLRGAWRTHRTASGVAIPVMPTLHPAYLLGTPAHKKLVWRDLLEVKARLRELASPA